MKTYLFSILFVATSLFTFAQTSYKYVIVPTQFPSVASGFNPYGISSEIQKILNEKSITSTFETSDRPLDYCETLTVELEKVSNMFKNRLKVSLRDCQNRIIWSKEGTGDSKEYKVGYAEALADAFKDLDELPVNITQRGQPVSPVEKPLAQQQPAIVKEVEPVKVAEPEVLPVLSNTATQEADAIYKPTNLYYNYTYFLDLVDAGQGSKKLVVINGELLGYANLQTIATLTPSGLGDVYTVQWKTAAGTTLSGVANQTGTQLNISLSMGDTPTVISLQAYK